MAAARRTTKGPYTIDPSGLAILQELTREPREYGGVLRPVDYRRPRTLYVTDSVRGTSDEVSVPISTYEFHTHTSVMDSNGYIVHQFPSETDIETYIHRTVNAHTVAHFLVTREALYTMTVESDTVTSLRQLKSETRDETMGAISKLLASQVTVAFRRPTTVRKVSLMGYVVERKPFTEVWGNGRLFPTERTKK